MNVLDPIYTEQTECQDCYKCVRICPFKAIKIENGHAVIIPERCVYCGKCVEVCPPEAKRVRNDISRIELLFSLNKKVIASIAPSFLSEFDITPGQMVSALLKLGFTGVSETALGAELLSADLRNNPEPIDISISSACPVVVEVIEKYYPNAVKYLSNRISPLLTHCKMIKERFGDDTEIVFIGPCIAKKIESDRNKNLLNIAITFKGLRDWFKKRDIVPESLPEESFITERSKEGNFYPIEGGFLKTINPDCSVADNIHMAFSGMHNILNILNDIDKVDTGGKRYIIEALACKGGCINGPMTSRKRSSLIKRVGILKNTPDTYDLERTTDIPTITERSERKLLVKQYKEDEIFAVLKSFGKKTKEDELNCGGCGYDSCRDLAIAVLDGIAEKEMCVTYNRRLAQKKANALLKTIPSGVVIVNDKLQIIECNLNFAKMFIEDANLIYDIKPGLEGAILNKTIPEGIVEYFKTVLSTGRDTLERDVKVGGKFIHFTIFSIEKNHTAGGVFQDVTSPMVQKKNIIDKAQIVISNNLKTVQMIANLLGENAADTEVILNSVIESFDVNEIPENKND